VGDAAGESLEPSRSALELVGGADVEHEVAVEDGDDFGWGDVFGEHFRVSGLGAAVAADKYVEPLF